ncbi:hypothetical protein SAMN05660464_0084 [Geodermatophilus dictyosporus]|uniref:DUF4386 family protein n=1 Tax=Geodermatophilus dictyosporus TaxID=1523247 RepID=A0A1I5U594_9ACTN|nr:hypothetical protein [Geodermatophilus dictyosporus]SFP90460.1 hypothetical protein SAMN05660464_0084 [Geodermatophilus dictyosporus]
MSTLLVKVGGAAAALSGVLVVVQDVWSLAVGGLTEGRAESAVHATQVLLLVPGVVGLYLVQQHAMGRFGQVATLLALLGSTAFSGAALTEVTLLPELTAAGSPLAEDPGTVGVVVGLVAMATWIGGLLLFGVATWRAGVLPRPAAALFVVGLLAGLALGGLLPGVLAVYAAGLVWLGIAAVVRPAPRPAVGAPAVLVP